MTYSSGDACCDLYDNMKNRGADRHYYLRREKDCRKIRDPYDFMCRDLKVLSELEQMLEEGSWCNIDKPSQADIKGSESMRRMYGKGKMEDGQKPHKRGGNSGKITGKPPHGQCSVCQHRKTKGNLRTSWASQECEYSHEDDE